MANERLRIGLALSGGGHRAAAFHFGVLARIAIAGLLDQIEVVSTVSGGSIALALVYAQNNNTWITREDYINRIVKKLRAKLTTQDMEIETALQMLKWPYNFFFARQANSLATVLRDRWGVEGQLKDVGPRPNEDRQPNWIINTMTIETGKNWRFERYVMGDYITGYTPVKHFPINRAVAASGAFPVFMGPFNLKMDNYLFIEKYQLALKAATSATLIEGESITERLRKENPKLKDLHSLNFWDGGLYDNLGVQPLLRHFKFDNELLSAHMQMFRELRRTDNPDQSTPAPEYSQDLDFLVVSDASPKYTPVPYKRCLSFWRLVSLPTDHTRMMYSAQVVSMLRAIQRQAQAQDLAPKAGTYLQFDNSVGYVLNTAKKKDHLLKGVTEAEINKIAKESLDEDTITGLASYGTHLKKMREDEFDGMYRHGFEQADATLYAYNPGLGPEIARHIPFNKTEHLPGV